MTQPKIPDFLVCPACKGPLMQGEKADELVCPSCEAAYEVRDGIPVMSRALARTLAPEEARRYREKRAALREKTEPAAR